MVCVLDGGVRCQLFSPVGRLVMALLRRPRRPGLGPVRKSWCGVVRGVGQDYSKIKKVVGVT
jgi:hypothetical protein